uniref:Uncharacterized protein n=1 Tax=Anguilla anguilla TaxID=7936 RepID=A0A0E9R602_ANGAN
MKLEQIQVLPGGNVLHSGPVAQNTSPLLIILEVMENWKCN